MWAVVCAGSLPGGMGAAWGAVEAPGAVPIRLSPALPAAGDALEVEVDVVSQFPLSGAPAVARPDGRILLDVRQDIARPGAARPQTVTFEVAGLAPAGNYLVVATLDGAPFSDLAFTLRPRTALLDLLGARFQVAVDRQEAGATATAVRLSDASGYFWFYDRSNPELTVKIVDGRAVNGHFWIFIASMTDVAQTVTVTDLGGGCKPASSCPSRVYANAHGNRNFIDTDAFGDPPPAGSELSFADLVVVSPALPSRRDEVKAVVNGLGPAAPSFAPPSIDGGSIALFGTTPPGPGAPGAAGRWSTVVNLGTLAPGSYTLLVVLDGFEYLTQAFTVRDAATGLALAGGRFVVSATRPAASGAAAAPAAAAVAEVGNPAPPARDAPAAAVAVGDSAGYFWFFDSSDLELTVKILDGRPVNGHFWVFVASMTDQPYTVSVVDTAGTCALAPAAALPCPLRRYVNPAHSNRNFIDVAAF